jgi:hypothetical protein
MFTIVDKPTFRHEIKIHVPVDGGFKDETVQVTYRVLPVEDAEKHDLSTPVGTKEFLQAALVKIDDVVDGGKQAVPYSDQLRDLMLSFSYVRVALAAGYFSAVAGARAGN